MPRAEKPSPTESPLLFEIDREAAAETLTAPGVMPLVVQAFRSLGPPASVQRHVRVKERERGYDEPTLTSKHKGHHPLSRGLGSASHHMYRMLRR